MILKGTSQGDDLTLLNTVFIRGEYINNKREKDTLAIIYKNNTTGEVCMQEIDDPDYEYQVVKDEYETNYTQLCVPFEQAEVVRCKYSQLLLDIAKRLGLQDWFYENARTHNSRLNVELHKHPKILGSDKHIEDHYRMRFNREYTNKIVPITKAFLDIEADTEYMKGDFPELGECPINAVTIIFEEQKQVYTLLLETEDNPQIPEFKQYALYGAIQNDLKEFVIEQAGGPIKADAYGLTDLNFNFLFYKPDEEINLILDSFRLINMMKPNFVLAWNMAFDIPYFIERIRVLGYRPEDIMCHPDFKYKKVDYFIDQRAINDYAERGDQAVISSYSVYLDQMIHFASRRKGRSQFSSFGLDYIGGVVAKVNKVDYKHITTDISKFPKLNYKLFVFYNIFDTIVQKCVEVCTKDVEYVFAKCNSNDTRYSKCHRQTVYLTNRGTREFYDQGFYIGNNKNSNTSPPTTKYPGAFVADPSKVSDYSKLKLNGHAIDVFDNLDDFDYRALYPSVLREFNMAANTQIGMVNIDQVVHDKENRCRDDKWSRAGQYMEDLQSNVWLEFAHRWFHLANYIDLYRDVIKYFTSVEMSNMGIRRFTVDGYIIPVEYYDDGVEYKPISYDYEHNPECGLIQPLYFCGDVPYDKMEEFRQNAIEHPNQQFTAG